MKNILNGGIKGQKGQTLIMALILLAIAGLMIAPLLAYMNTGLLAGGVHERKADELYAADAGVEDAIWRIENQKAEFDQTDYWHYPDPEGGVAGLWVVNEKSVEVEMYREETPESTPCHKVYRYRILSTATSADGTSTTIEAYLAATVDFADLSGLMDHIITINENLTAKEVDWLVNEVRKVHFECREECANCTDPCGTVYDYQELEKVDPCYGCGVVYNYNGWWPHPHDLSDWYKADVNETEDAYFSDTLYVQDHGDGIGPLYRNGKLKIINTGPARLTLKLNDTVYATSDTEIGLTNQDLTLDLNGHTIFVESDHTKADDNKIALQIGGKCIAIDGPGAIIAVGDIYFQPNVNVGTNGQPVFVLSVSGTTTVQPNAYFYGSVAGNFYVEVKSGQGPEGPTFTYPPGGFGNQFDFFPAMFELDRTYRIESWRVIRPWPG